MVPLFVVADDARRVASQIGAIFSDLESELHELIRPLETLSDDERRAPRGERPAAQLGPATVQALDVGCIPVFFDGTGRGDVLREAAEAEASAAEEAAEAPGEQEEEVADDAMEQTPTAAANSRPSSHTPRAPRPSAQASKHASVE